MAPKKPRTKKRSEYPRRSQDPNKELSSSEKAFGDLLALPTENGRWRNRTEAYRLTYPNASRETAAKRAIEIFAMPAFQIYFAEKQAEFREKLDINENWIRSELKKRYYVNPADFWATVEIVVKTGKEYPLGRAPARAETRILQRHKRLDELTPEQLHLIDAFSMEQTARGSIKTEFKFGRQAALESLIKGAGFYKERIDLTSGGKPLEGPQIVFYIPDNGRDERETIDTDRATAGSADDLPGDAG